LEKLGARWYRCVSGWEMTNRSLTRGERRKTWEYFRKEGPKNKFGRGGGVPKPEKKKTCGWFEQWFVE